MHWDVLTRFNIGGREDSIGSIDGLVSESVKSLITSTNDERSPASNYVSSVQRFNKNMERYTAHTMISRPNPKQWQMGHTSDSIMIFR